MTTDPTPAADVHEGDEGREAIYEAAYRAWRSAGDTDPEPLWVVIADAALAAARSSRQEPDTGEEGGR